MNKTGTMLPKPSPQTNNNNNNKFSLEKMETAYISNLEQLIRVLSDIVILFCSQDVIENNSISELNKLHSELKYQEKMRSESEGRHQELNRIVQEAIYSLKNKNQEFPKIKHMKSQNGGDLSTIAEKYSEENLLANYLRKNSSRNHQPNNHNHNNYNNNNNRNLSYLERYSETINTPGGVEREETRRSLDNSNGRNKKPIYGELEKIKTKEVSPPRNYNETTHRKFQIKSKLPYYNISKLI